jgi:hypothetical protein
MLTVGAASTGALGIVVARVVHGKADMDRAGRGTISEETEVEERRNDDEHGNARYSA